MWCFYQDAENFAVSSLPGKLEVASDLRATYQEIAGQAKMLTKPKGKKKKARFKFHA